MRIFGRCCLVMLILVSTVWCQDRNNPENVIKHIIDSGMFEGHDEKVINGIGDASAVVIIKLLGGSVVDKQSTLSILDVLNHAFVGEARELSDHAPSATLFLLKSLDCSTNDAKIKSQISHTRERVVHYAELNGVAPPSAPVR